MHKLFKNNQNGFSVIEVLISLTMAGIIIVSVGNVMASTHRLDTASAMKEKALAYAKESIEIINDIKDSEFACLCNQDPNGCGTDNPCERSGGICTPQSGYNSCWVSYTSGSLFHLEKVSGQWHLATGIEENFDPNLSFKRKIEIVDLDNSNRKKITVTVSWEEQGHAKDTSLSTILTAWKNITTNP